LNKQEEAVGIRFWGKVTPAEMESLPYPSSLDKIRLSLVASSPLCKHAASTSFSLGGCYGTRSLNITIDSEDFATTQDVTAYLSAKPPLDEKVAKYPYWVALL
jgi:hypothetical protein